MFLKYLLLFLLLLHQNPAEAKHNVFERSLGTSFSLASELARGGKPVQMQVCITVGCCHHVCRQFASDDTPGMDSQPVLAPFSAHSLSTTQETEAEAEDDIVFEDHVVHVPSSMEWTPQAVLSPSVKLLTVLNTGNTTWIRILKAVSTDEQFFLQGLEEEASIAPGESLTIPVVFLPWKTGVTTGNLLLRTSTGRSVIQLCGEGVSNPYGLSSLVGLEAIEGKPLQHRLMFHNPYDEQVEVTEVQVWPGDSYKKAVCLSALETCLTDRLSKAVLSSTTNENYSYSSQGSVISLKQVDSWTIQPQNAVELVEIETTIRGTEDWSGAVFIKHSRNDAEEVMVLPMELRIQSEGSSYNKKVPRASFVPSASGKWIQTNDQVALKVAESLLKDLAHNLLRQPELKKGSLSANRIDPTLVSGDMLAYKTVQRGHKENLYIKLVNPRKDPVLVNLILPTEVKSENCKYKANWFWQGEKPQLHTQSTTFSFRSEADTEGIIPGHGQLLMGPVTFQPKHKCDWSGLLFIKNNISGLEWIPLRGRGGSGNLVFLKGSSPVQKLTVVMEDRHNLTCDTRVYKRGFQVKNTGDVAVEVYGVDLSHAPGVALDKGSGFKLAAGKTADMMVFYEADVRAAAGERVVRMATSAGALKVAVAAKLPPELVALCRDTHEQMALSISVCALVLVLGVFSWLLLQEVSSGQSTASTRSPKISKWKRTWRNIASVLSFWRLTTLNVTFIRKKKSDEHPQLKPVVTLRTSDYPVCDGKLSAERCKTTRKMKRSKSNNSSGSASPHSSSESEMKIPPIERILNSSRLSETKPSLRRSMKSRSSLKDKELVVDKEIHEEAVKIPSKVRTHKPIETKILRGDTDIPTPKHTGTVISNPLATFAVAPGANEQVVSNLNVESQARGTEVNNHNLKTQGNGKQLTSIGLLRREAAQLTIHKPEKKREEPLYDIWGDHFAEISSNLSTPSTSNPQGFVGQSLFSQSLPTTTSKPQLPSSEEHSDDFMMGNLLNLLPEIETYTGIPDWNFQPVYKGVHVQKLYM